MVDVGEWMECFSVFLLHAEAVQLLIKSNTLSRNKADPSPPESRQLQSDGRKSEPKERPSLLEIRDCAFKVNSSLSCLCSVWSWIIESLKSTLCLK